MSDKSDFNVIDIDSELVGEATEFLHKFLEKIFDTTAGFLGEVVLGNGDPGILDAVLGLPAILLALVGGLGGLGGVLG